MKQKPKPQRSVNWRSILRRLLSHDLIVASLVAIAVIGIAVGLGYESNKLILPNPSASAHYQDEPNNPLAFLAQWDSTHYIHFAEHGYSDVAGTNFFPLYPLTVRIVHIVVNSPLVSALVVSWISFVAVVYFFLGIVRELYPKIGLGERLRAALLLVLFPTAIFFIAAYTESLFVGLALATIYMALRKNWLASAILAGLASATHLNGLFIAFFAGLLLWEARQKLWKSAAVLAGGALGCGAYFAYLAVRFHTPLVFLTAQANHSTVHADPLRIVSDLLTRNGIFFVLLVAACIYWWRRHPSFTLYGLLYVAIVFIGSHGMSGLGRYTLAALPVPLMLYDYFRNKSFAFSVIIALSAIGWAYFTILYVAGYTGG